jgi:hypothetical protein
MCENPRYGAKNLFILVIWSIIHIFFSCTAFKSMAFGIWSFNFASPPDGGAGGVGAELPAA